MKDIHDNKSIEWIKPERCSVMLTMEKRCPNKPKHIKSGIEYFGKPIQNYRRVLFWVCCEHYTPFSSKEQMVTVFG